MPNTPDSTTQAPDTVHRTVRLRLFPGDAETGALLAAIAGACRYVWNHMLADCEWRYCALEGNARAFGFVPVRPSGQGLLHGEGRSRGGPRRPVNEMGRLSSPGL